MRAPGFLALSSALALSLAGCGDDVPSVPTDAGPRDAQVRDGGGRDGGELPDGALPDGALLDGEVPDGGGGPSCTSNAEDLFELGTELRERERPVRVAAGATRMAAAWSMSEEGVEQVVVLELPQEVGSEPISLPVTTGFDLHRDPAIAATPSGWVVAWSGNPGGDFEIYTEAPRLTSPMRQRLTTRAGRDDSAVLLATATGLFAAWVETRTDPTRVLVVRPIDADGAPTGAPVDASPADARVGTPVLAVREGGLAAAWVDSTAAMPNVLLQPLDASGARVGSPTAISTEGNASGTVDLALSEDGGAVVFGVSVGGLRPEVRARLLGGDGSAVGSERPVTIAPETGRDPSIVRVAGGFVIAFRAIEGGSATIRLALLDATLERIGSFDVAPAATTGGPVTVRLSGEGRLVLGWADVSPGMTRMRAARVRCE